MRAAALWALALGALMLPARPVAAAGPAAVKGATEVKGPAAVKGPGAVGGKARIIDGDTLEIAGQRFRLYGIKAPDLGQVCHRAGQVYGCGKAARGVLWYLVAGREVSCAPVGGAGSAVTKDGGALAAICTAGDTSLNESMVITGWAVADPAGTIPYGQLEQGAKVARRGLWTGEFDRPHAAQENPQ